MLTIEDCIRLSELTEEEVIAIAEHEHIADIIAAELGNYLLHCPDGTRRIAAMIRDDIAHARAQSDFLHSARLRLVLQHFLRQHAGIIKRKAAGQNRRPMQATCPTAARLLRHGASAQGTGQVDAS